MTGGRCDGVSDGAIDRRSDLEADWNGVFVRARIAFAVASP
ncbi:hypothetical protein [Halomontanus rarus]|nr:hypothetical protein [Halovivax sp. TS33]